MNTNGDSQVETDALDQETNQGSTEKAAEKVDADTSTVGQSVKELHTQLERRKTTGEKYPTIQMTPRRLLALFNCYRRTSGNVSFVNAVLKENSLEVFPNYNGVGMDAPIVIRHFGDYEQYRQELADEKDVSDSNTDISESQPEPVEDEPFTDPVHRVARFMEPREIVRIDRNASLEKAITLMLMHDYSQLPVMQGDYKLEGMISWQSIGKCRLFKPDATTVADCIDPCVDIKDSDSIFSAVRVIAEHDVVVVKSDKNKIVGILTATDISCTFEQISKPFLLISYIENHLRALIRAKFSIAQLGSAKDPNDTERKINDVSDLTFGEYVRLLEKEENWKQLGLPIEKKAILEQLEKIRLIRNDVMHFDPEGIEDKDILTLKEVNQFLELLASNLASSAALSI